MYFTQLDGDLRPTGPWRQGRSTYPCLARLQLIRSTGGFRLLMLRPVADGCMERSSMVVIANRTSQRLCDS